MNQRQEHELDKLFRKKLEDLDMGRQDHLWKGIADQLEKNRRTGKLIGFGWFTGIIVAFSLIGLGIGLSFKYNSSSLPEQAQEKTAIQSTEDAYSTNQSPSSSIRSENLQEIDKNNTIAVKRNKENLNADADYQTKSTNKTLSSIQINKATISTDNQQVTRTSSVQNSTEATGSDYKTQQLVSTGASRLKFNNLNYSGEAMKSNTILSSIEKSKISIDNYSSITGSNSSETGSINNSVALDEKLITDSKASNLEEINALSKKNSLVKSLNTRTKTKLNVEINDFCFAKNLTPLDHFDVDVYFSPEISTRTMTARSEGSTAYVQKRAGSESFTGASSFGLRFSYVTKSGLALRLGLNRSSISERFDFIAGTHTRNDTIRDNNGVIVQIVKNTVNLIEPKKNVYKFIDIPVMIGYEMDISDFVFSFNTGVGFNISSKYYGQIYSDDLMKLMDLNAASNEDANSYYYRRNIGMSLLASFGLNYKLNGRFLLLAEPNLRYYLNSVTSEYYPIDQRYLQLGISLGLRYRFY